MSVSAPTPGESRARRGSAWLEDRRLPVAGLVAAMIASGVLLIAWGSELVFFIDDWHALLHRRGFSLDAFLEPHGEHPLVAVAIVYKAIQATFGMDSVAPYVVASIAAFLVSVALLFVYMRQRVGGWLALAGALLILFLGAAYEDLLIPFQLGYFGSVACGLGALLALERDDRRGDVLACGLLVASLAFASVGIPFIAGIALWIALDRRRLARAYVVVVPVVAYGVWYLGWGHEAETQLSFENLATTPSFVLDGFASSIASILGLAQLGGEGGLEVFQLGRPLALLAGAALALVLLRGRAISPWLWVALVIAVGFWLLTGLNSSFGRSANAPRYQYIGAVMLLLVFAEAARGTRPGRGALAAVFAVVAMAVAANLNLLYQAWDGMRGSTELVRGGLAGLEISAETVPPDFVLTPDNSGFNYFTLVDAGPYLDAAEKFGSPAYPLAELAGASEQARTAADRVQAAALPVELEQSSSADPAGCEPEPLAGGSIISLAPSSTASIEVPAGDGGQLFLRRYASESFPVDLGPVFGGRRYELRLPGGRSAEPWELTARAPKRAPLAICAGESPG